MPFLHTLFASTCLGARYQHIHTTAVIFFASLEEVKVLETVLTFSSILLGEKLLLNPLIVIDLISKPACGTIVLLLSSQLLDKAKIRHHFFLLLLYIRLLQVQGLVCTCRAAACKQYFS